MAHILGTPGSDLINGSYADDPEDEVPTDVADQIFGDPGNDTIFGFGGDDTLSGDTDNDILIGGAGADDLFGGTGIDTASYAGSSLGVAVSLADGIGFLGDAEGDTLNSIENLIGSDHADFLVGDSSANSINGGDGDDFIDAGGGANFVIGGNGTDTAAYVTFAVGVTVSLLTGFGSGGALSGIENLTGSDFADTLTGNDSANTIIGNDGADLLRGEFGDDFLFGEQANDILEGGGGADHMAGGVGDDLYRWAPTDVIDEIGGGGADTVESAFTFSLANPTVIVGGDFENLTLIGSNDIDGTGNGLANVIVGNSGVNSLKGGGGADVLKGGGGDDTYNVQDLLDIFDETGGTGFDTVASTVSFSLADPHVVGDIEALVLFETAKVNGTGNALANRIVGNDSANVIDGAAGGDLMQGRGGNDIYVVDNAADVVDESLAGSGGTDTVRSTVSFTFVDGVSAGAIERLTLLGNGNINGVGNGLANIIKGNDGRNVLAGRGGDDLVFGLAGNDAINGGAGADLMRGGLGNDTYLVANAGDRAIEKAGQGVDRVLASVSFTLGGNVENLILTGSANRNGTGNALGNAITGNIGANTLNGAAGNDAITGGAGNDMLLGGAGVDVLTGGLGRDVLVGGTGPDRFDFNAKVESPSGNGRDVILGFSRAESDRIDLSTIDADTSANPGNDRFAFIGAEAFHGGGGEVRFSGGIVQGDINGDRQADFEIKVVGVASLVLTDFVL